VANRAVVGEIAAYVIGVAHTCEVRLVARVAVLRRAGEHPIDVTLLACHRLMGAGQLKRGPVVVEGRRLPGRA